MGIVGNVQDSCQDDELLRGMSLGQRVVHKRRTKSF